MAALLDRAVLVPADDVLSLASEQVANAGATAVSCWLIDADRLTLRPIGGDGLTEGEPARIEGTRLGRAFISDAGLEETGEHGTRLFLPMVDGSDRLGVLAFTFAETDNGDRTWALRFTRLVALLIVAKGRYTDQFVNTRRSKEMSLAAQVQWQQLPPLTMTTEKLALSGVLEPAYDVGGDSFDYALNDGVLHVAIVDAMGHGIEASLMSTVIIAAYRLARRAGVDLVTVHRDLDAAMTRQFGTDRFATAQIATLDAASGVLRWVNAGHPLPLLIRAGRVVGELEAPPGLPLGLGDVHPSVQEEQLDPGDRVLFLTDGIVEERLPGGDRFGLARLREFTDRAAGMPGTVDQLIRRLSEALMTARGGSTSDDATMLLLEWTGAAPEPVA